VSAQNNSMYSRTESSTRSLSGSAVRAGRPSWRTARRLAGPYSSPSSTTIRAAVAAISVFTLSIRVDSAGIGPGQT
jgi:hypothetical protein